MRIVDSGVLSRSVPGTDRANLTFPAVLSKSDGTLIATWHSGTTKDCADEVIEVSRSTDSAGPGAHPAGPSIAQSCMACGAR